MAKYLVLYRADRPASEQMATMTPEAAQAEMQAWMAWGSRVGERLIEFGEPIADNEGVGGSYIGGYSIVSADSSQELADLLADHPHLSAGTIQALEILPVPGT